MRRPPELQDSYFTSAKCVSTIIRRTKPMQLPRLIFGVFRGNPEGKPSVVTSAVSAENLEGGLLSGHQVSLVEESEIPPGNVKSLSGKAHPRASTPRTSVFFPIHELR